MQFPALDWLRRVFGFEPPRSGRRNCARHAPLQVTRLEERRVLNAAPTAVLTGEGVLTVSTNVSDGSAAAVHMKTVQENGHSVLDVNVNGQSAYHGDQNAVKAIHIAGSSGSDTLIIDFSGGNPIPHGGLVFNGAGQGAGAADSVKMIGGSFSAVSYSITQAGAGAIQLAAGANTSVVALQNVEQVNDSLVAAKRSFSFSQTPDEIHVSAGAQNGQTQVDVTGKSQFLFQNPTEKLSLNTDQGPNDADRLTVNGVGRDFNAKVEIDGDSADQVTFAGRTALGVGDLQADAGRIDVQSAVVTNGGKVELQATTTLNVTATGSIETRAAQVKLQSPDLNVAGRVASVQGGSIELNAGPNGSLLVSGQVDASATQPGVRGGTIHLLGSQIGLFGNAVVNASGPAGGGTILVGGDAHGTNTAIQNAAGTYVGTGVTLRADATSIGNGGKIVIWSDRSTIFFGALSARGGANGGNGGFAEVSGGSLRARGEYDLGAPAGDRGTLLFDPVNIQIVGGTGDGTDDTDASNSQLLNDAGSNVLGSILFSDTGTGSPFIIYESEIENTDANIILEATHSITTSGTFTNSDVVLMNDRSLTLRTRNNAGDGDGGIDLTGSVDGANLLFRTQGTGMITIEASTDGGSIGNVVLGKLQTASQAIGISTKNGTITFNADVNAGTGTVTATSTGAINQSGGGIVANSLVAKTLNSAGAGITLTSATNDVASIDLRTRNALDIANAAGTISYRDSTNFIVAKISTTGNATLRANSVSNVTQSGTIEANGLELLGTAYSLNNSSNDVTTLAGNVTGNLRYRDVNAITIGTVNTVGVTATGTVILLAGGAIDQTQAIQADVLSAQTRNDAGASIILTNASNDVNGIGLESRNAANDANAGGTLSYRDSNGFAVEEMSTTANVTLQSGGAVTQTSIALQAAGLELLGTGSYTLDNFGNDITTLAGNVTADVLYRDSSAVRIGTVNTVGMTSANLTLVAGGEVDQVQKITTGALSVKTLKDGGSPISLGGVVNEVTSIEFRSRNAADTATSLGPMSFLDVDGVDIVGAESLGGLNLVAGGAVTDSGQIVVSGLVVKTLNDGGANITLDNASNNVTSIDLRTRDAADAAAVNAEITYIDSNAVVIAGIETGLSGPSFARIVAGGAVTQTCKITARELAVKTLNDTAEAANITLDYHVSTVGEFLSDSNEVRRVDLRTRNAADDAAVDSQITFFERSNAFINMGATRLETGTGGDAFIRIVTGNGIFQSVGTNANLIAVNPGQTGQVTTKDFVVKTLHDSDNGAAIDFLGNPPIAPFINQVSTIDLRTRNAADTAAVNSQILFSGQSAFKIARLETGLGGTSGAAIWSNGTITQGAGTNADLAAVVPDQTGKITTRDLLVYTFNDTAEAANIILDYHVSTVGEFLNDSNEATFVDLRTLSADGTTTVNSQITYYDKDAITLTRIQTGSGGDAFTRILAGGPVTQAAGTNPDVVAFLPTYGLDAESGKINTRDLVVKTLNDTDGAANITLNYQVASGTAFLSDSNEVATVDFRTRNAADNGVSNSQITFYDKDTLQITRIETGMGGTASATIVAGGGVIQGAATNTDLPPLDVANATGKVETKDLVVKTLNDAGAAMTLNFAGNTATSIDLRTRDALDTAAVDAAIVYNDGNGIDIKRIETGTGGSAKLGVADAVTQSGAITTGELTVNVLNTLGASITLTESTNAVTSIDLRSRNDDDTANAGGTISYRDSDGFDVVKVSTTGNATLQSGGAVTQSGSIEALGLELLGAGPYTFSNSGNDVTTLAGNVTNVVTYRDANGVTIGTVNSVGLTASDISITVGAAFTQTQAIVTGDLVIKTLDNAGANITLTYAGNDVDTIDLQTRNAADTANAAGTINFVDLDGFDIVKVSTTAGATLTAGDAVTQSGSIEAGALVVKTLKDGGAAITLANTSNAVASVDLRTRNAADNADAAGTISYRDTDGFDVVKISTTANATLQSGGAVTQSGSIAASGLELLGSGPYTLTNTGNAVTTLAGNVTNAVQYTDVDGVAVGTVSSVGLSASNFTIIAGGAITQSQAISTGALVAKTLNDAGAAITLANASNAVTSIDLRTRNAADSANAAGTISFRDTDGFDVVKVSTTDNATLQSGAAVTQSGSIEAAGLELLGAGPYTLSIAGNDITTLAGNVTNAVTYRDANGVSIGTVNTAGLTASDISITLGGAFSQSQEIVTGDLVIKTLDDAGASITLTDTGNDVDTIDLQTRNAADTANAAGTISYRDSDGFDVVKISTTAGATLVAGDAITQAGSIEAGALVVKTLKDGGANITLASSSNAATSVDLQSRNAADTANAAGTISYRDSDGFDVVKVSTTANATLQSGGAVTQTGTIEAAGLELLGLGPYTLTNSNNAITTLAGNLTNAVQYTDVDGVAIGTVNTVGLTASNVTIIAGGAITQSQAISANALVAKTLNDAGANITLDNASNAVTSVDLRTRNAADSANAAGTISFRDSNGFDVVKVSTTANATLQAGAAVSQSGTIEAAGLELLGSGPYTLTNGNNAVTTLAGNVTNAVQYTDLDGIAIGTVNTVGLTASTVTLIAGGAITQSQAIATGALVTKTLNDAGAAITLTNAANAVTSADLRTRNAADSANVAGAISFRDSDGLDLAKVSTTSSATLVTGGALTQSGTIEADALAAKTLNNAGASITLANSGNAVSSIDFQTRNAADTANVAGTISYRDTNGFDVVKISTTENATLQSGAAVTQSGTIEAAGLELLGTGPYTLTNTGNAITTLAGNVTNAVQYTDLDGVSVGTVNTVGLAASNVTIVAGDAITQTQAITTGALAAKTLNNSGANITLANASNAVTSVDLRTRNAADAANVGGTISFRDSNGFDVVKVSTTANATLQSGAAVTQSGTIEASGLELLGAGPYTLTNVNNAITTLAGTVTGAVQYTDVNGLAIGTVNTVGLTASTVTLITGDAITQSQWISTGALVAKTLNNAGANITLTNASNAVTSIDLRSRNSADTANAAGTISFRDSNGFDVVKISTTGNATLQSGAAVTESGTIEAAGLELLGTGPYTLNNAGNAITTLAANVTGNLQYRDSDALTIGTVNTVGLTAANATLVAGGAITQTQVITTGALVAKTLNDAGAAITLTNAANAAASVDLRARNAADTADAAGPIDYRDVNGFDVVRVATTANASLTAGGAVTESGSIQANGLTVLTLNNAGASITLMNAANAVSSINLQSRNAANAANAAGTISYRDGDGFDIAKVATSVNATLQAGGTVTQSNTIEAAGLELLGTGSFVLTNFGNAPATLAGNTTGSIQYSTNGALTIGTVNTAGLTASSVTLNTGGAIGQTQAIQAATLTAKTLNDAGASIVLNNGLNNASNVDLRSRNAADTANAAGAVVFVDIDGFNVATISTTVNATLQAGGTVTESGTIEAAGLELLGNATYVLTAPGNSITTLAANVSGGVSFSNSSNAGLTIGTVNGTSGITNTGAAAVQVTSGGPLTVQNNVLSQAGGSIALQTTAGNLTTNARVAATGGSGNLTLAAAQSLLINDTGFTPDIQTTGNGVVTGTAGSGVVIGPNVVIQSGFGQITAIPPNLTDVTAPQITSEGLAEINAIIGRLLELDFTVNVNWSDGTIDVVGYTPPGAINVQHIYIANPNQNDSAAPIPVIVTLFGARNINFPGQNSTTFTIFLTNPGDGARTRIDISAKVPVLTVPPPVRVDNDTRTVNAPVVVNQTQILMANKSEGVKEELRQVFLEILTQMQEGVRDGQPLRVQLPESTLDDLSGLFKRLPDGKYRLILLDAGETQGRVLLEFDLRQHKISDSFEEERRETPTESEAGQPQSLNSLPRDIEREREQFATTSVIDLQATGISLDNMARDGDAVASPLAPVTVAAVTAEAEDTAKGEKPSFWPQVIGGTLITAQTAAWVTPRIGERWAERLDKALAKGFSSGRYSRSLRPPVESDAVESEEGQCGNHVLTETTK